MLTEIVTAAQGLQAASKIVGGLVNLKTTTEVQAKAIKLNQLIIGAQTDLMAANVTQSALVNEVRDLKAEIARMKNWEIEKQRYQLAAPFPGCMVYALKKSMSNGETAHYLCASCYKKGQPSILQGSEGQRTKSGVGFAYAFYGCNTCGTKAVTSWTNVQPPNFFEDIIPQQ